MCKIGIVFPGQGSQYPLIGKDFYDNYEVYKNSFDKVFEHNKNLKGIWSNEAGEEINLTENAQLILFANQISILQVIKNMYEVKDCSYAGFSLGEYSALCANNLFSYEDGLSLVKERANLMGNITSNYITKVALGKTKNELEELVNSIKKDKDIEVIISNYNLEKQLLINFPKEHEEYVTNYLKEQGLKRLVDLKVSGPFHTYIYKEASNKFYSYLQNFSFLPMENPLYLNYTGQKVKQSDDIKQMMQKQMINGVLWYEEIQNMILDGIDTFIEIGSKSVLSAMIKKINKDVNIITIEKVEDLNKLEDIWIKK